MSSFNNMSDKYFFDYFYCALKYKYNSKTKTSLPRPVALLKTWHFDDIFCVLQWTNIHGQVHVESMKKDFDFCFM